MKNTIRKSNNQDLLYKIGNILIIYLKTQLLVILLVTIITGGILSFLKIEYAIPLAVLAGTASTIPFLGMTLAAIIAGLVAIFDNTNFLPNMPPIIEGFVVLVIFFIINQLTDYFLTPFLVGKSAKVHPLLILVSVIIGTIFFGFVGTFLAVPAVLVVKTIVDHNQNNK